MNTTAPQGISHRLLQILNVIGYQGDKQTYVREFDTLNRLDALAELGHNYPLEIQEQIRTCITPQELQEHISIEEYSQTYYHVSQHALMEFVGAIQDSLEKKQKDEIFQLISLQ